MKLQNPFLPRRILINLAFLVGVATAVGASDKAGTTELRRITEIPGFLVQTGKAQVAVSIEGKHSKWLEEGMTYEGNTIVRIDAAQAVVKIRDSRGDEYSLALNPSRIAGTLGLQPKFANPSQASLLPHVVESERSKGRRRETIIYDTYPPKGTTVRTDDLDWDWINSEQNPMHDRPANPVDPEFLKWPSMSKAEKDAFIELYRQCGYEISVITDNKGVGMISHRLQPKPGGGVTEPKPASPVIPKT